MSYYKTIMTGNNKKKVKKVIKEHSTTKPKANKVLESIKKEFNLKEVGMASDVKKYQKAIDKDMMNLANSVNALKDLLIKNGAKKEAQELGSIFVTNVGKFRKFIKIKFIRMIRNLI